jgi:hypothetical protein
MKLAMIWGLFFWDGDWYLFGSILAGCKGQTRVSVLQRRRTSLFTIADRIFPWGDAGGGDCLKIILSALGLAVAWTVALAFIARTYGLHSGPGIWAGVFGLPGVVIANWVQGAVLHRFDWTIGYGLMFVVNWGFYCSVILGVVSLRRSFE